MAHRFKWVEDKGEIIHIYRICIKEKITKTLQKRSKYNSKLLKHLKTDTLYCFCQIITSMKSCLMTALILPDGMASG